MESKVKGCLFHASTYHIFCYFVPLCGQNMGGSLSLNTNFMARLKKLKQVGQIIYVSHLSFN